MSKNGLLYKMVESLPCNDHNLIWTSALSNQLKIKIGLKSEERTAGRAGHVPETQSWSSEDFYIPNVAHPISPTVEKTMNRRGSVPDSTNLERFDDTTIARKTELQNFFATLAHLLDHHTISGTSK